MSETEGEQYGHIKDGFFPHYPIYDYSPYLKTGDEIKEDIQLDEKASDFDLEATCREFRYLKSAFFAEVERHITDALAEYKKKYNFGIDPADYMYSMATNAEVLVRLWEMSLQYDFSDERLKSVELDKKDDTMTQLELDL